MLCYRPDLPIEAILFSAIGIPFVKPLAHVPGS